jgi:hypothetical protein
MGQGLACSAGCSFSKSWCGEAFHELGIQSADVSALPGALPQSSMSPASQQSPLFTEPMRSAAVSQSPSWILHLLFSVFEKKTFLFVSDMFYLFKKKRARMFMCMFYKLISVDFKDFAVFLLL